MNHSSTEHIVRIVMPDKTLGFRDPLEFVTARAIKEVRPALEHLDAEVAQGCYVAGFIAYEAAPAFDPALLVHPAGEMPLLWFGVYEEAEEMETPRRGGDVTTGIWEPSLSRPAYESSIETIHERIAAGDTYQVNFTFPMRASFEGDALAWFGNLCRAQGAGQCAYVDAGRFKVLSASPELFFSLDGEELVTRPMKGTRPRGRWLEEDEALGLALKQSEKDRAENIMIVDMLRNDMGRISETGTVDVRGFFDVERYETVWQMTSTIASRTRASIPEILTALFPSGSVTGAPKVETMKIIHELEAQPRGVYCGTIGYWGPGRRAWFNVPIRTVTVDTQRGEAWYGVGSGVTWDSTSGAEYRECLDKAQLLTAERPDFQLIETLRFDGEYFLLEEHLARLAISAAYFGFRFDEGAVRDALARHAGDIKETAARVRLLLAKDSGLDIQSVPLPQSKRLRVGFATQPVDSRNIFLYHKTTHRAVYEEAKALRRDCDDVILWNERGEITESTIANIVVELDGKSLTPARDCGLLAGTYREHLLKTGEIAEARLTKTDLERAGCVYLINSVRGRIDVEWVE